MSDILAISLMVFVLVQWYFIITLIDRALPRNEKETKMFELKKWFNKRMKGLKKRGQKPKKDESNLDRETGQKW